jgi:hypothetical protein
MALPKKKQVKYSIDVNPPKIGTKYLEYGMDRIEKLMKDTDLKTKYLPRTILFEDLDQSIFDYVDSGKLNLFVEGKKVPTFYLENERWGELSKTWKFYDNDKNVPLPYVTIRRVSKNPGTRIGNKSLVPQQKKFRYLDVPILDEGEIIYLRFKMPEPVNVDMSYEVSLFTKYRVDVNQYDQQVLKNFSSKQDYVFVKNTPFPILLDTIDEANTIENIDGDRFYVSKYNIKLLGYIIDEKEFEITKTFRKARVGIAIER